MEKTDKIELSHKLKPLCPRDNRLMHYESESIHWQDSAGVTQTAPSYHCGYTGCSVRYNADEGYFTVVDVPDVAYFVEEPGTNISRCPEHGTWLYRTSRSSGDDTIVWRCAIEDCDYSK
jgi:hypothetical protein